MCMSFQHPLPQTPGAPQDWAPAVRARCCAAVVPLDLLNVLRSPLHNAHSPGTDTPQTGSRTTLMAESLPRRIVLSEVIPKMADVSERREEGEEEEGRRRSSGKESGWQRPVSSLWRMSVKDAKKERRRKEEEGAAERKADGNALCPLCVAVTHAEDGGRAVASRRRGLADRYFGLPPTAGEGGCSRLGEDRVHPPRPVKRAFAATATAHMAGQGGCSRHGESRRVAYRGTPNGAVRWPFDPDTAVRAPPPPPV